VMPMLHPVCYHSFAGNLAADPSKQRVRKYKTVEVDMEKDRHKFVEVA
jgi:hypothetical protein